MSIKWHGDKIKKDIFKERQRLLADGTEYILDEANKDVPHDEGTLQRSGSTDVDARKGEGTVFYDTPYAQRLHEHPEYRFQKGRKGKWLENTMKRENNRVNKFFADGLKRIFKG